MAKKKGRTWCGINRNVVIGVAAGGVAGILITLAATGKLGVLAVTSPAAAPPPQQQPSPPPPTTGAFKSSPALIGGPPSPFAARQSPEAYYGLD